MYPLRPNRRGILQPQKPNIQHGGQLIPYHKHNPTLHKIDKLMKGEKPRICISRKKGGIGDVLMTTPTVKSIAAKYGIQVDYATDFNYLEGALPKVLKGNPYIKQVIPWDKIDIDNYDAVLDLTCPCVAHEKPKAPPVNRVDLFAKHLGVKLISTELDYLIEDSEEEWAEDYIHENRLLHKKLVLIQPFASAMARSAPTNRLKNIINKLRKEDKSIAPIIITHGSDVVKSDWSSANAHVMHNYDVRQIAAIMNRCALTICPDSAILHVAAALHHPTLTIFGPTDPHARVNYHPEAVAYWPAGELKNYPTWYAEPKDGYLCWKIIEEDVIVNTAMSMLNQSTLPSSRALVTYGPYEIESQNYEIL